MTITGDRAAPGSHSPAKTRVSPPGRRLLDSAAARSLLAIVLATVALFLVSAVLAPQSVGAGAISAMLPFAAILAVVALGQTLVVQQSGIDLSVPGAFSLAVVIVARLSAGGDTTAIVVAVAVALAATAVAGLVNGLIITYLRVTPIVATLGMNALLLGAVWAVSEGAARRIPSGLSTSLGGSVLGVPVTVLVALVFTAVIAVVVKKTAAGRRFEVVGASERVAAAAGIRRHGYVLFAYSGAAALYGLGGVLLTGIVNTPGITEGNAYLLPSVAAVVLGGTSLRGGKGNIVASLVAALFFTQVDRLVSTLGLSYGIQIIVQALALALGVAFHSGSLGRRRRGAATSTPADDEPEPESSPTTGTVPTPAVSEPTRTTR